jgi:opacity protein-like surface antigen
MTARGFALACALLLLSADSAYAQDYARNGFYVGVAGSIGIDTAVEDELEKLTGVEVDIDEAGGLQARLGYRFHPRISTEIQFEWLDDADISLLAPGGKDALSLERFAYTANAKAYLLTGFFQPFVLAGVGLLQVKVKDSLGFAISVTEEDFAARFGGGVEIYATEKIAVNLDASYVLPTGNLKDFDYISIGFGAQYRF